MKKAPAYKTAEAKTCRELAVEILEKVEARGAYADLLLDHTLKTNPLAREDGALLTQLVYGTLRWRGKIDWMLDRLLRRPLADTDAFVRNLIRLTIYQIRFLDRVPDYAAVNEAVELAKRHGRGAAGLVNAVARRFVREKTRLADHDFGNDLVERLAVNGSHPEWLVRKWLDHFGAAETEALLRANNDEPPLVLRANRLKTDRALLVEKLRRADFDAAPAPLAPDAIRLRASSSVERVPGFEEGLFVIQSEASQLIGSLVGAKAGERILDAAAAPGGKTTHLAELMDDAGEIVAADISSRGIGRIKQNIDRLELKSIHPVHADSSRELTGPLALPYDRILADLPCSGLGTLRSHPEAKWRREAADIARLSRVQKKILDQACRHLKPGGTLVYSTCTLTGEENEEVVQDFLTHHEDFILQNAADFLPASARHMVSGRFFLALPHRDDTDGFFAARLRKRV